MKAWSTNSPSCRFHRELAPINTWLVEPWEDHEITSRDISVWATETVKDRILAITIALFLARRCISLRMGHFLRVLYKSESAR